MIPLSSSEFQTWKTRLDASAQMRKQYEEKWKENQQAYLGKPLKDLPTKDVVVVNLDFANVEQKKAQLFFQNPEVQLEPKEPLTQGMEDGITPIFEAVINDALGPNEIDALTMVDEALFDVLCTSGIGATKIGYEAVEDGTVPVPTGRLDPLTGGPALDPLTGQPETTDVPRIVDERYFWERFSPMKLLLPAEFTGTDFDKAAWLGMEYTLPYDIAKAKYNLPDTFHGVSTKDAQLLSDEKDFQNGGAVDRFVILKEIWYKPSLFPPAVDGMGQPKDGAAPPVKNPQAYRQLVVIDGMDEPAEHRDSPYQTIGPDGRLTPDSMLGNPIHPLVLRGVSDQVYVPSDCQVSRATVHELWKGRTQMIQQRDRSLPMRWVNLDLLAPDDVDKIKRGEVQSIIPITGNGNEAMGEVARSEFPRENFSFDSICKSDVATIWAMDENQRGLTEGTERTATELQIVQQNASTRLSKERERLNRWYAKGAMKIAALLLRFGTKDRFVQAAVGPQGAQRLAQWNKDLAMPKFAFSVKPDSGIRLDPQAEQQTAIQQYQMMRRDPNVNANELLTEVFRKSRMDPSRLITQPPPQPPEKPNISYRFSGPDLANPIVLEILQQAGIQISPQSIMQARMLLQAQGQPMGMPQPPVMQGQIGQPPAPHPGAAPQVEPLSKHAADRTGERSGPKVGVGIQ